MSDTLKGSEIIRLAGEINEKINAGKQIHNFTIGDFDPHIFPLPEALKNEIIRAYEEHETNYPAANGILPLRKEIASLIKQKLNLEYSQEEILIAGGARPLIYAAYQAILNPEEKVLFPVPSWNNNHYSHLSRAQCIAIETKSENDFMPRAEELKPYIEEASLVALCSPLNPTGTVFSKETLLEICELIIKENQRREPNQKPLYLLYDQIYWMLTFGGTSHFDPVSLLPEMKPYTIYIDGISKSFAATGVRVGWAFGPEDVISKMKSILGHVGAWAPKAEQVATARYIASGDRMEADLAKLKSSIYERLQAFHKGFSEFKAAGYAVDSVAPAGAIYLTVKFAIKGKTTPDGKLILTTSDVTTYLLDSAGLAIVPFVAFGASADSDWFRLSVGTSRTEEIPLVLGKIENSLKGLR
ncbi:MAG: aminotransferase class I/II-fold pyridoxal phosphate-dependent enzyme [Bacteroidetes bacterium]|nr:aminotransferase class I/II-fold pyridoxal phosphate-dependent enzyme [Bacteroidota bacterium]